MKNIIVRQTSEKDCGPCCLLMIIKYYGGNYPLNKLIDKTKTTENGTNFYNLLVTAKKIGFKSTGVECDIEELFKQDVYYPAIAHQIIDNYYSHFVVILSVDKKKRTLKILDPAVGEKIVKEIDFKKTYTKKLLLFSKAKTILKEKEIITPKQIIKKVTKSETRNLRKIITISLISSILTVISAYYFKYIYEVYEESRQINLIIYYSIIFLIIFIISALMDYFKSKIYVNIENNIDNQVNSEVFNKILSLPYMEKQRKSTGELISKIDDLNSVKELIANKIIIKYLLIPFSIIGLISILLINIYLCILILILSIVKVLVILKYSKKEKQKLPEVLMMKANYYEKMTEYISSYETIKGLGIENKVEEKLKTKRENHLSNLKSFYNKVNTKNFVINIYEKLYFTIIIITSFLLVNINMINLTEIIFINSLLLFIDAPLKELSTYLLVNSEATEALKRICTLYYEKKEINEIPENFEIKYKNKIIKPGEKILITGANGSGKSTFLKQLKGFIKSKDISIGNKKICNISDNWLKENIVYVGQKEKLFNETIFDNLSYMEINEEKIKKLITSFNIPKMDINKRITEEGNNISGGERQKIQLIRAILKNPNILIIDETTSEIDLKSEKKILDIIMNLNITVFFVSHKTKDHSIFNQTIEIKEEK